MYPMLCGEKFHALLHQPWKLNGNFHTVYAIIAVVCMHATTHSYCTYLCGMLSHYVWNMLFVYTKVVVCI